MGRPTDAIRHRFERILQESDADSRIKKILKQTEKPDVFLKAYEVCLDRAYGRPSQSHELSGEVKIDIQMINYADNNPA